MNKDIYTIFSLFVIAMFILMPEADALAISGVNVKDVSDRYSIISWLTDEAASSTVFYKLFNSTASFIKRTSSVLVTNHTVILGNLDRSSSYVFNVSSANNNGTETTVSYNFTTSAQDIVPPFINVKIPEFYGDTSLFVSGTTEPNTEVYVYVNGNISGAGFAVTGNDGDISLPGVLLRAGSNSVRIIAIDPSKNQNEVSYRVFVDKSPPDIQFTEPKKIIKALNNEAHRFAIGTTNLLIKGESDEPALMDVTVKNAFDKTVFSTTVNISSPWETTINFPGDGVYSMYFVAVDRTGVNYYRNQFVVTVDSKPLRIERTNLPDLTPSHVLYTTVRGKVSKPNSTVIVFIDNETTNEARPYFDSDIETTTVPGGIPTSIGELIQRSGYKISTSGIYPKKPLNYVAKADEKGNFQVDIALNTNTRVSDADAENLKYSVGNTWLNHIEIIAVDEVGNFDTTGIKSIIYTRCGASGLFSISSPKTSPGSIPEPVLEQGYGQFSMTMDMSWTGSSETKDVSISSWRIKSQTISRQEQLGKYNLTVGPQGIFDPSGVTIYPRKPSPDTKQIYAFLKLKKLTKEIFPSGASAGDVFNAYLEFPLELEITYTYLQPNGEYSPRITQKTCVDVQLQVEPDATHLGKYKPTRFLNSLLTMVNGTINMINMVQKPLKTMYQGALIWCGVGIVVQFAKTLSMTWGSCAGIDLRLALKNNLCTLSFDSNGKPDGIACSGLEGNKQAQVEACFKSVISTMEWQEYWVDMPCDRIFCQSIPSIRRHSITYSDLLVYPTSKTRQGQSTAGQVIAESQSLGNAASQCIRSGNPIFEKDKNCETEFQRAWKWASIFDFPYGINGAYERAQEQVSSLVTRGTPELQFRRDVSSLENLCNPSEDGEYRYVKTGRTVDGVPTVWRIAPIVTTNNDGYKDTRYELSLGLYVDTEAFKAQEEGNNIINPKQEVEAKYYTNLATFNSPIDQATGKPINEDFDTTTFKCISTRCNSAVQFGKIEGGIGTIAKEQRLPSLVITYLTGLPTAEYSFDPTSGFISSVRAMCLPAIQSYLTHYKTMLLQAQICLQEIIKTGKGSAGLCNAFMSTVICDIVASVISCLGTSASKLFGSAGLGTGLKFTSVNPLEGLTRAGEIMTETISSRYGGTVAYKTLFDQNKLVKSFCVAAFSGDWDLGFLSDLLTQATVIPVKPTCLASIGQRKFISSNPLEQGKTTYLYHVAGMIGAGADVTGVQFQLICSADQSCTQYSQSSNPGYQCDCFSKGEKITMAENIQNSVSIGNVLNEERYITIPNSDYRYDKFRISFSYKNNMGETINVKDCQTFLRDESIPPSGCEWNFALGSFRCEFIVGEQGIAKIISKPTALKDDQGNTKVYFPSTDPRNFLMLSTTIQVLSPDPQNTQPKWAKYQIWNNAAGAGRLVIEKYFILDEGEREYDFPNVELKREYFSPTSALGRATLTVKNPPTGIIASSPKLTEEARTKPESATYAAVFYKEAGKDAAGKEIIKTKYGCADLNDKPTGTGNNKQISYVIKDIYGDAEYSGDNIEITCFDISFTLNGIKDKIKSSAAKPTGDLKDDYTYVLIKYTAPAGAEDTCTEEVTKWRGLVTLYNSMKDPLTGDFTISSTPVLDGDKEVKESFEFSAACIKPASITEASKTITGSSVTVRAFALANQNVSAQLTNNYIVGQNMKVIYEVTSASEISQMYISFKNQDGNELKKQILNLERLSPKSVKGTDIFTVQKEAIGATTATLIAIVKESGVDKEVPTGKTTEITVIDKKA